MKPTAGLYLFLDTGGLYLCQVEDGKRPLCIQADFVAGKTGFRLGQAVGRKQPLARAVGAHKKLPLQVIDLTAGLGRDAMVLAVVGCQVCLFERQPVVAALLEDGFRRALVDARLAEILKENIDFHPEDGMSWLRQHIGSLNRPVVYYDPMFPKRDKSSLVKKEMRLFQQLVGEDEDVEQIFSELLQMPLGRIVVKRPRHAETIGAEPPSHQIISKSTRWDIYLPSSGKGTDLPAS